MKPIKGLFSDTRPQDQPEGTYPFGKNGIQYDLIQSVISEPGFKQCAAQVPYTIHGVIGTDNKPVIFSTNNTNSAIGYFNQVTELYEPIFDDAGLAYKLGFKVNNYITGEAQRNYKGEQIVFFTDKVEFPKYANLDNLQVTRLQDWDAFPYFTAPTIQTTVDVGGRLLPGTYYAAIKYLRNDGTESPFSAVSQGRTVSGNTEDAATDKALTVNISNPDTSYDQVILVVISKVKGVTKAVELEPVQLNPGGVTTISYTGNNFTQDISLEEILTPSARYNKVGTIGQLNDSIYIANLQSVPQISDMQQYANIINVRWVSELINAVGAPPEHVSGEKKGFMHDETYALYIRYWASGTASQAFAIPGNTAIPSDLLQSGEATTGNVTAAVFQTEDTVRNINGFAGDTGIWQNTTERYPDTIDFDSSLLAGRNLRNQPVLHHKMPSTRWCKQNLYPNEAEYGRTKLDILGLQVSNIVIPAKYQGIIDGYEILYAKRTTANITNFGQSLLLYGAVKVAETNVPFANVTSVYTTGANWNSYIRTRASTSYDDSNDLNVRLDTFRLHAFDLLLNRPSIKASYLSMQLRLRRDGLRPSSLYQDGDSGQDAGNTSTVHLLDYTQGTGSATTPQSGSYVRGIVDGGQYLNININIGKFINNHHETTFGGRLNGPNLALNAGPMGFRTHNASGSQTDSAIMTDYVETYLTNLKVIRGDIYQNFYSQPLVSANAVRRLNDLTTIFGGDIYVCDYTFHTYGRHEAKDQWAGYEEQNYFGKKVIHRFVCESVSNIHLRYEIPGNEYSKWYPNNSLTYGDNGVAYPEFWDRNRDPNQFGYSKDLNALNDLFQANIFNPFREQINTFPFRIHRGGKLSRQNKRRSWRTFLPLDYYELQKNLGLPIHLEAMYDRLLIHCENALLVTRDKTTLQGDGNLSITLGTGDIFQFEPQEAQQAKLGYAGSQHELACVRTPIGYIFPDAKMGQLWMYDGQKLDNLSKGLNRFLSEYTRVAGINCFNGNGITIGWDEKYKRILVTVKNFDINSNKNYSFTLSYSGKSETWSFYHDYLPDYYFHTRDQVWNIKANRIYKNNFGAPGLYHEQKVRPFFIDVVFRNEKGSDMLLEAIDWNTELLNDVPDNSNIDAEWNTFTHITIWNSQQHTGKIPVQDAFRNLQYQTSRRTKGEWSFNDFRNILNERGIQFISDIFNNYVLSIPTTPKPWYQKEDMQDKYFIVRLEFDNNSGKQIILHEISATVKLTDR